MGLDDGKLNAWIGANVDDVETSVFCQALSRFIVPVAGLSRFIEGLFIAGGFLRVFEGLFVHVEFEGVHLRDRLFRNPSFRLKAKTQGDEGNSHQSFDIAFHKVSLQLSTYAT